MKSRPQELCLMCGRCCRVVTTSIPYKELITLAKNGDEAAKEFLSIFQAYPSIGAAKKVHPEVVDNILNILKKPNESTEEPTFYKCKHILDNNLCSRYESRPELCEVFPATPWAVVPPGCGFEYWLSQKREEYKNRVRKLKEMLIEFETMLKETDNPDTVKKLENAIEKATKTIDLFAKYGAKDW